MAARPGETLNGWLGMSERGPRYHGRVGMTGDAYEAFGIEFECRFPVPELRPARADTRPDVVFGLESAEFVKRTFSGPAGTRIVRETLLGDGCRYRVERGRDGDRLIEYGDRASFLLAPDASLVMCAPTDPTSPEWRRFLLDTVLGTVSLVRGFEALHAAGGLTPQGVVAVAAGQGGGKSTLLVELLARGGVLFNDDILALAHRDGDVVGFPGPPLLNLPVTLPEGSKPESIGRVLARIDGECWTAIDRPAIGPAPIAAVVFLERAPMSEPRVERMPRSPAPLLAHSLLSGADRARLARRFALLGDLADQTPMLRLSAPSSLAPLSLARMVEDAMAEL